MEAYDTPPLTYSDSQRKRHMALAHEPDIQGLVSPEETLAPRWSEAATFASLTQTSAPAVSAVPVDRPARRESASRRSIYDMPIDPLPAPNLEREEQVVVRRDAIVLPFARPDTEVHDVARIDYRPLWVATSFLAASLCASVSVAPTWFAVAPEDATSTVQRFASQVTALIGVTGIAALAAVLSTALLLFGAQRTR